MKGSGTDPRDYKGRWRHVAPASIPGGLRALPQDYRHRLSPGHDGYPTETCKGTGRKWEKR